MIRNAFNCNIVLWIITTKSPYGIFTQKRLSENAHGESLPKDLKNEVLNVLDNGLQNSYFGLKPSDISMYINLKKPIPKRWQENRSLCAIWLSGVVLSAFLCEVDQMRSVEKGRRIVNLIEKLRDIAKENDVIIEELDDIIKPLYLVMQTAQDEDISQRIKELLLIDPTVNYLHMLNASLKPYAYKFLSAFKKLFLAALEYTYEEDNPMNPYVQQTVEAAENNAVTHTSFEMRLYNLDEVQWTIYLIARICAENLIPYHRVVQVFQDIDFSIEEKINELTQLELLCIVQRHSIIDPEISEQYVQAVNGDLTDEHILNILHSGICYKEFQDIFKQFILRLCTKEILIEEDIVNLGQNAGEWYHRLLDWIPFCKGVASEIWLKSELKIVLKDIYCTFIYALVDLFYYVNDADRALYIFSFLPHFPVDKNNLTEYLERQYVYIKLLCAVEKDPRECYMEVKKIVYNTAQLSAEQDRIFLKISNMYIWALLAAKNANIIEINEILNKIKERSPLAFERFERVCCTKDEAAIISKKALIINIQKRRDEKYILDIVHLSSKCRIRRITPAVCDNMEGTCCSSKLDGFCNSPVQTCENCCIENNRVACSVCQSNMKCDIYQAYNKMQHAFFLFKKTWENELPFEMARKGLRLGAYIGYGFYYNEELIAYIDVKKTMEENQEVETFGFAFTQKEYRSQKLIHGLINYIRLIHPYAIFRMTTNQLNSSMLRCCKNIGFYEYGTKSDRIFASIKTCCEELPPLAKI